jgi:hypothetical protein
MRLLTLLIVASLLWLSGCSLFMPASHSATVTAERLEPGGKGLFVVRPQSDDPECLLKVPSPNGRTPLDCASEYLVACDASTPESKPFCSLVREKGPVRDSIYPAGRR